MDVTTISGFRKQAKKYFDQVVNDQTPLLITRSDGVTIVAIPLEQYNALTETEYLLRNPENAKRLRRSLKDAQEGKVTKHELVDV